MKIIELFSGIGGFTKGFLNAGYTFEEHYYSEIDKHAIANYKYNFKNAKHIGSVTTIPNGEFKNIDIITFGSPCQDFSLAGQRKGLKGDKSSLISEAIRLVSNIRPRFFIWENVKGAFSSNNGADFAAILQAFANIGGYRLEWQLLNTSWFLPQNRERIYLVGHLAEPERDFRPVFPIGEDDFASKEKGGTKQNKSQTKICSTIGTKFGNRPSDTFIKIGTIRTFEGLEFREMTSNLCPALAARAITDGNSQPVIKQLRRGKNKGNDFKISPTITSNSLQENNFLNGIRRLTEIECERLQGFPDDWTKYGVYGNEIKEIPKTQRYKMLGNAVSVPVVKKIAERLK